MKYWDYAIATSSKGWYYYFLFFAVLEGYSFFIPVLTGGPRGFLWYWSAVLLVYAVEFLYQWRLRKQ